MILDGKSFSAKIKQQVKEEVKTLLDNGFKVPTLAVVIVGDDGPSQIYVNNKKNACAFVGIKSVSIELPATTTQAQLEEKLKKLPLTNKGAREFVRFFLSGAIECEIDKQGRFLIAGNLREYAKLEKDTVIIGVGTRIEI